jgi:hypothetical protein
MLLWKNGQTEETWKMAKLLQTTGPKNPTALQLERLLWLKNNETPIRLPHAALTISAAPPEVDGLQSDLCWFGNDHFIGELQPVGRIERQSTKIWATYDKEFFYLFAKSQEPNVGRLSQMPSQPSVWMSDCIETFFNPGKEYAGYYQFVGNAAGKTIGFAFVIRDQDVKTASLEPGAWDAEATTAVNISVDSWTYEMKIPWKQLGVEPKAGESFFFNVRRFRYNGPHQEIFSWSPVESSAHEPETFGILILK